MLKGVQYDDADAAGYDMYDTPREERSMEIPSDPDDTMVGMIDMWARAEKRDIVSTFDAEEQEKIKDFVQRHIRDVHEGNDQKILQYIAHIGGLVRRAQDGEQGAAASAAYEMKQKLIPLLKGILPGANKRKDASGGTDHVPGNVTDRQTFNVKHMRTKPPAVPVDKAVSSTKV